MSDPIVVTELGKLKGKVLKNNNNVQFYSFKGIPYAKPPVGELRFSVPQPPESWEGVRDGTKECNTCAQFDKATGAVVGDEDCLYLNVYTPKLPEANGALLPVMFFLHGGGFVFGGGTNSAEYGPDFLIEKGVVLVSINYRLGVLGFLSLNKKEAPGNMGLRDQVQALKWVQKNISNFSGDPNNVTIFGFSAGGASVEYLLLSPMAKDLFHKAIAQSGSSLLHWAQNDNVKALAAQIPERKGKAIANDDELLKYLKEMPIKDLIMSSMDVIFSNKFKGGIHFGFVPAIENPTDWEPFISKSTYQSLDKGEFTKVPFMTGFCTHEGLLTVSHAGPILANLTKEKNFIDHFPFELNDTEKTEYEVKLRDRYLKGVDTISDKSLESDDGFAIDFFSDADFIGGVYTAAMLVAKNSSPVYLFEFSYDGALNFLKKIYGINRKGACHSDDGGYLLTNETLKDDLSDTDKYVKNLMLELWTNFSKFGDPTPTIDELVKTKWEPIPKTGVSCYVIDGAPYVKDEVYPASTELYQEIYEKKFGGK